MWRRLGCSLLAPPSGPSFLPQRHRGTEAQRLKRALRSQRRQIALRGPERSRRRGVRSLVAASSVKHRGKTKAPSEHRKLCKLNWGTRESSELGELFSLCDRCCLAATPPRRRHDGTSPRTLFFSLWLCASVANPDYRGAVLPAISINSIFAAGTFSVFEYSSGVAHPYRVCRYRESCDDES